VVTVCTSAIDGVNGSATEAYNRLSTVLAAVPNAPAETREWALSTLGEVALRAGRDGDAERIFREALAIDADDPYVVAALADLLLDTRRPQDAARLVEKSTDNDGLLLRLAIAEKSAKLPHAGLHADLLASRYDASRLRGDVVHRREQARFELGIRGDAKSALALARANWDVQREPWDARILLESALAADDASAAAPVVQFVRDNHLEDPRITALVAAIAQKAR
jgi:predicted Zn-dependent protease